VENLEARPTITSRGVKVHLGTAQILAIRAIEITNSAVGDALMLPELLEQVPADEQLHSVGADGVGMDVILGCN